MAPMQAEVAAWERDWIQRTRKIDWQFTTAEARITLKRLYSKLCLLQVLDTFRRVQYASLGGVGLGIRKMSREARVFRGDRRLIQMVSITLPGSGWSKLTHGKGKWGRHDSIHGDRERRGPHKSLRGDLEKDLARRVTKTSSLNAIYEHVTDAD